MVKVILWDNDGVLVDTEHLYYQACREVLIRYNISFDEERYIDLFLRKSEGLLAILHENNGFAHLKELLPIHQCILFPKLLHRWE